jgi:triacylglycerol lipase
MKALVTAGAVVVSALAFGPAGAAAATPTYPDAVVMVSGYNSASSFTTPDPSCEGQEGDTWSNPDGPAAALRAAGFQVFTAPVKHGSDPLGAPCAPGAAPVPPAADSIDSYGDNDVNGAAFASFLAFLRDQYGVQTVQLVAHSDGGNWSRSAMTQDGAFNGLAVESLTTLGTPYTGSMVADFATELRDGRCDFSDDTEQDLCEALLVVIKQVYGDMGPTTIEQLTHAYLEPWNREQTIGACPVTTIAGTGLDIPLIPFSYYDPSDGLVGKASALAQSSFDLPHLSTIPAPDIPNLRSGGTFPVVHAPSLGFISKANLLNTPAISSKVVSVLSATPSGGATCNAPAAPSVQAKPAETHTVPFRLTDSAMGSGRLGPTGADDVMVVSKGVKLSCGPVEIPQLPFLGRRRVSLALPGGCKGIRVSGAPATKSGKSGKSGVLLVGSSASRLEATRAGRSLEVKVTGPSLRGLKLKLRRDEKVRPLRLQHGSAKLPAGHGSATLIASAKARNGRRVVANLVLSL